MVIDYVALAPQTVYEEYRAPKEGVIAGSNDGETWETMHVFTNQTSWTDNVFNNYVIDTNVGKGFKYVRIIIEKVQYDGTDNSNRQYTSLAEIKIFGHKENDTTRFPISSTVLKYPHIAMTGPAQRGYVVTTNGAQATRHSWLAFDGSDTSRWMATGSTLSSTGASNSVDPITDTNSITHQGVWITLELPYKIEVKYIFVRSTGNMNNDDRRFKSGKLFGSNDNSNFDLIGTFESASNTIDENEFDINSDTPYKYITFLCDKVWSGSYFYLHDLKFYGTEEDLDIVARVGEGLDGKVANFRVYDKYLHEEQALELWDAQKDLFGRATSSVSVYRGHVGIGTTEPEAALTVMDEAEEMGEFPPRAMTDYETYMEGHGVFKASASIADSSSRVAWCAFTKSGALFWRSDNDGDDYNTTTGVYEGARQLGSNTPTGEYLTLELPYDVKLVKFSLLPFPDSTYYEAEFPRDFTVYGRKNRSENWEIVQSFTDSSATAYYIENHYTLQTSDFYRSFAISVTKNNSENAGTASAFTSMGEWRLFGTRERGQSTLHDGELKLTKNLTVPRIGPPLDADDTTPRRDRLVVEYNTWTNPTENGVVRDTSGRGLDGLMLGGASYDATGKALVFDGTDDYVFQQDVALQTGVGGVYSASVWVNNRAISGTQTVYSLGTYAQLTTSTLYVMDSELHVVFYNSDMSVSYAIPKNTWTHIVVTHAGGPISTTTKMYINGVDVGLAAMSGTLYPLSTVNFPSPCNLFLGRESSGTVYGGPMDLSNFKLYDVALTATEVKRLYDMGRCDEGHHVVNFSKTRVGIGLGDGEAPQAALEVRDVARFHQIDIHHDTEKDTVINFRHYLDSAVKPWEIGQIMGVNPTGANNSDFKFATSRVVKAWIDSSSSAPTVEINNFTGQHRTFIKDVPFSKANELEGLIVSSDQNKYIKMSGGIEVGSNAITTNESLPVVSLSNVVADKRCFGVISASEDPETRQDRYGNIVSVSVKEKGDTRVYINSVGEGAMWVTDINGPLESGDYITTSNVAGYGQKQDGAGLMNYTVAKITMDCDFEPATQPIQRIKQSNVIETHYTGMVSVTRGVPHEFVTTTVTADDEWSNVSVSPSDVTYAEWSNLEANIQNTYTLTYTQTSNVVYDVKYTKTTTANVTSEDAWDAVHIEPPTVTYAEYSNLEANVQNTYSLTFTRTTTEEKTPSEWSGLDANAQALWSMQFYDMVEQKVDADYPGAVAHNIVTNRLENDLDEHGQIQWEDDPSGATEKAYKIRYLDASGQQTDEANCVYRAAFVGCTYHCG